MEFPILDSRCRIFAVCGQLVADDARLIQQLGAMQDKMAAAISEGAVKEYVVVWGGGKREEMKKHLHVDVVSADIVRKPFERISTPDELVLRKWE